MSVGHAPEAGARRTDRGGSSLPRRGRVLVVDDDRVIRHLLTQMLDTEYEMAVAGNGHDALHSARQFHPDVIITDLVMPDGDGWDLITELRRDPAFEEVQIIAISGADRPPAQVLDFGADDFISKPFDSDELSSRVAVAVSRRQRLGRLHSLLDALPIGVFMAEFNGQLLVVNDSMVEMLGFASSTQLCTHRVVDLIADHDQREQVAEAVRTHSRADLECTLYTDYDWLLRVHLSVAPAVDDADDVTGIAGVLRPITKVA